MANNVKCPECNSYDLELIKESDFDDDYIVQPSYAPDDENTTASRADVANGSSGTPRIESIKTYRCNKCKEIFDLLPNSF